jgi:16S rRNA (cytosine967-C5)-methyltransferase
MTPGARIQASIELLDQIFNAWQSEKRFPADKMLEQYFKGHRYIGSKDRGAVAELVYWVLRHKAVLSWWLEKYSHPLDGRMFILAALILRHDYNPQTIESITKDSVYSPETLVESERKLINTLVRSEINNPEMPDHVRLNYPQWLDENLRDSFGDKLEAAMNALSEQAPTDLRVNTLKTHREKLLGQLQAEGFDCSPTLLSPVGIRLTRRAPIFTSKFFKEGHFEVQDEGSQMVAILVDAKPSQRVIDFCAGAGGKTLAIAATMENKGRILAWDTSKKRLDQINLRLKRAGVHNVQIHVLESEHDAFIKRHKATADRVLIDVPCSGSGTWRRNPDLKWRFTKKDLDEVCAVQKEILQSASRLVKVGGRLIYATCSIFKDENERQVENFLKSNNHFRVVCAQKVWDKNFSADCDDDKSYFCVTPHEDGVDGFFAAVLERLPA